MNRKHLAGALACACAIVAACFAGAAAQTGDVRALPPSIQNARAISTLTIASGSVTATQQRHLFETEAAASLDDLTTVVAPAWIKTGDVIEGSLADASHKVTLKNGAGANLIATPSGVDWPLTELDQTVALRWTGSQWRVVAPRVDAGQTKVVADKAAAEALTAAALAGKSAVIVTDENYGGTFAVTSAKAAEAAADPAHAIYIPCSGDDGTNCALQRIFEGAPSPGWFGGVFGREVSAGVATTNATALDAVNLYLSNRGGGAISWGAKTLEVDCSASNQTSVAIALRNNVAIVGVKPENSSALMPELGRNETGTVLRLRDGSNCSLVGLRTGNKGQGLHNIVLDVNKEGNTSPGNHAIMAYAHDSSNGLGDGLMISGVRAENATGYSLYLWDVDPAEIHNNEFRDGVFIGSGSDTNFSENIVDGGSPRQQSFNAATQVSANTVNINDQIIYDGLKVKYDRNGNTALTGLTDGNDYYVVNAGPSGFQVSATYGGAAVAFSAGTGTHIFRPYLKGPALFLDGSNNNYVQSNITFGGAKAEQRNATFTRSTNDIIVSDWQGFLYNNAPVMIENSGGALPAGLDEHNVYYARQTSGSTWNLWTGPGSGATQVTMSDAGTGTHKVRFGKYGEALLFSGSLLGKQGLEVSGNRFAGTFGANATLINMGTSVQWSNSNDLYEKNWGGGSFKYIEQIGDSLTTENIGFPYKKRLNFTNSGAAPPTLATINTNESNFFAAVTRTADATWGNKWRVTFTEDFVDNTQFRWNAMSLLTIRVEVGSINSAFFDVFCYVSGSASAPANISSTGSGIEVEFSYAP
jgi:hypothetical protein